MPFPLPAPPHRRLGRAALIAVLAAGHAACAAAVDPRLIEDARTVVRIRSVLVNDPTLGTRPVEVHVNAGTVRLSGRVYSEDEASRLVTLVRNVEGVVGVKSEVRVVPEPPPGAPIVPPPAPDDEPIEAQPDRRLLAVGGTVTLTDPRAATLARRVGVGALIRLGSASGLGPRIAFNWMTAELFASEQARSPSLGHVRVRPLMGGLGYTWRAARVSASASLVAGYSFNSLRIGDVVPGRVIALRVDDSFAWRPGLSLWYDLNDRFAVNGFAGYLVVRPRTAFLDHDIVQLRTLRLDSTVFRAGLAYKLF